MSNLILPASFGFGRTSFNDISQIGGTTPKVGQGSASYPIGFSFAKLCQIFMASKTWGIDWNIAFEYLTHGGSNPDNSATFTSTGSITGSVPVGVNLTGGTRSFGVGSMFNGTSQGPVTIIEPTIAPLSQERILTSGQVVPFYTTGITNIGTYFGWNSFYPHGATFNLTSLTSSISCPLFMEDAIRSGNLFYPLMECLIGFQVGPDMVTPNAPNEGIDLALLINPLGATSESTIALTIDGMGSFNLYAVPEGINPSDPATTWSASGTINLKTGS